MSTVIKKLCAESSCEKVGVSENAGDLLLFRDNSYIHKLGNTNIKSINTVLVTIHM